MGIHGGTLNARDHLKRHVSILLSIDFVLLIYHSHGGTTLCKMYYLDYRQVFSSTANSQWHTDIPLDSPQIKHFKRSRNVGLTCYIYPLRRHFPVQALRREAEQLAESEPQCSLVLLRVVNYPVWHVRISQLMLCTSRMFLAQKTNEWGGWSNVSLT